jgi:hypothetical protein
VGHVPGRWRTSMRAVELCRRAAHLAGHDGTGPAEPAGEQAAPRKTTAARKTKG